MTFTDEQLEAILGMPDFSAREQQLAQQDALARELRGRAMGGGRMDWASQVGRAVSGLGGAMQQYQLPEKQKQFGEEYRTFARGLMRKRRPEMIGAESGGYGEEY